MHLIDEKINSSENVEATKVHLDFFFVKGEDRRFSHRSHKFLITAEKKEGTVR